ncbi:kinesin [Pseudozyma hubeiensis SY62]|uniref:Kinesin n=1 Tax=Pseudozyma hubeiensis (strain SY62) TaxID=1305764 RepID=R9P827_PSEHS|nr:kinesin [Pseudozyma hubeiensis SY62]GAC97521.1 kinesin [Pseudozyma hubeiensis SY62]
MCCSYVRVGMDGTSKFSEDCMMRLKDVYVDADVDVVVVVEREQRRVSNSKKESHTLSRLSCQSDIAKPAWCEVRQRANRAVSKESRRVLIIRRSIEFRQSTSKVGRRQPADWNFGGVSKDARCCQKISHKLKCKGRRKPSRQKTLDGVLADFRKKTPQRESRYSKPINNNR